MTEQEFRSIYPPEIIELMLQRQEEQRNPRSIEPFLINIRRGNGRGGFHWEKTVEGYDFWSEVLIAKRFDVFYQKYPKTSNNIILLLL